MNRTQKTIFDVIGGIARLGLKLYNSKNATATETVTYEDVSEQPVQKHTADNKKRLYMPLKRKDDLILAFEMPDEIAEPICGNDGKNMKCCRDGAIMSETVDIENMENAKFTLVGLTKYIGHSSIPELGYSTIDFECKDRFDDFLQNESTADGSNGKVLLQGKTRLCYEDGKQAYLCCTVTQGSQLPLVHITVLEKPNNEKLNFSQYEFVKIVYHCNVCLNRPLTEADILGQAEAMLLDFKDNDKLKWLQSSGVRTVKLLNS